MTGEALPAMQAGLHTLDPSSTGAPGDNYFFSLSMILVS
jgi:hypothetical protein